MGILRKVVVGIVLVVAVVVGLYVAGVLQAPTVGVADIGDWGTVSEEETEIVTTVWVDNPNPVGASVGDGLSASYHIDMNGVRLAEGEKSGLAIQPGNNTVALRTNVQNENIAPWWVAFVQANETIDLTAGGTVTANTGLTATAGVPSVNRTLFADSTPVIDALSAAANESTGTYMAGTSDVTGDGPRDEDLTVGYRIERGWATWGPVDESTTTARFHFVVSNPGDVRVPAEPDGFRLHLVMNDVELFTAEGNALTLSNGAPETIPPGERRVVNYTVTMDNDKVDDWFRSHVRNDERTDVEANLQLVFRPDRVSGVEIAAPAGGVTAATCDLQTAILVDDQETETTCAGPAGVTEASLVTDSDSDESDGDTGDSVDDATDRVTNATDETADAVTNATDGTTATVTDGVTDSTDVELDPVAAASPESGETPLDVQFDATESTVTGTAVAEYVWRFDDGTPPARGDRVEHTFRTAGTHEVELTVVGENGNTASTTVTVEVEGRL
jgi:LEA14-like dessication related protein